MPTDVCQQRHGVVGVGGGVNGVGHEVRIA